MILMVFDYPYVFFYLNYGKGLRLLPQMRTSHLFVENRLSPFSTLLYVFDAIPEMLVCRYAVQVF